MKKFIATLFVAALATSGLVVATGGSASANCTPTQYSGCVATKTKVKVPGVVAKGTKATVCAKVKAIASNATPTGIVKISVKRNSTGIRVLTVRLPYSGGEVCAKTGKLRKTGAYTAKAKYKSPSGSIFINSLDTKVFQVVG